MHLLIDELNSLDCISLPAPIYDSVKEYLMGFHASYDWRLRYDFSYRPIEKDVSQYEAVDFDFANQQHYDKAAAIICGDDEDSFNEKRVKKMTLYSAFDPSLSFFVKDKVAQELAAISISAYDPEVKQTDLDWIYVAPKYQGKGSGRFLIEETIRRCKDKSEDICVAGEVDFY